MSLQIRNLRCGYGKKRVLNDVSLAVHDNEIVALIGHNGAGKSTLLKAIAGLLPKAEGEIAWDNGSILGRTPAQNLRAGIVYCPEGAQVFRTLTVRENLALGGYAFGNTQATRQNIAKVLDLFPALAKKAGRKRRTTRAVASGRCWPSASGSSHRRASPCSTNHRADLAPMLVETVFEAVKVIVRDFHTSVLLVEQNIDMAFGIADRAYVLANGTIVDSDVPAELMKDGRLHRGFFGERQPA